MRVPEQAGPGTARVTLSFPAWKAGRVASAIFEIPVVASKQAAPVEAVAPPAPPKVPASPELLRTLDGPTAFLPVTFSTDGKRLAAGDYAGQVTLWDVATGKRVDAFRGLPTVVDTLAYAPDGKLLAYSSADHPRDEQGRRLDAAARAEVRVRDLAAGKDVHTAAFARTAFVRVAAFDGRALLVNPVEPRLAGPKQGSAVKRLDLRGDKDQVLLTSAEEVAYVLAASRDGGSLLVSIDPPRGGRRLTADVAVMDAATGRRTKLVGWSGRMPDDGGFTPDGKGVLVLRDRAVRHFDAATGKERPDAVKALNAALGEKRFEMTRRVFGGRYSPDGSLLALMLEVTTLPSRQDVAEVLVWDVAGGRVRAVLRGHTSGGFRVAFSPDGTLLATAGFDKTVRLWKVPRD